MGGRWAGAPRSARVVAAVAGAVLAYGTAVHVVQLVLGGDDPYPGLPGWLSGYFVSLTLLDPLAGVLLWLRRRSGVVLTVGVLVSDAAANAWADYALDPAAGVTVGRVGQAVVTVLALAAVAAAPLLWRAASPVGATLSRRRARR